MADAIRALARTDLKGAIPACLLVWTTLDSDDSGAPAEMVDYPDMTVAITGTFGVAGSITMQGSNDGTNYFALTDPQGNAITKTAAGMEIIVEAPRYVRPLVTGGDGTTSLTATVLCRRVSR
jgi:hypothetical protein